MPRAADYLLEGYTYHLTHRCHERQSLLQFSRERTAYRKWLYEGVRRYRVPIYAYCITSTHVHVVARVDNREATSALMQLASGSTAKGYNTRKEREGSMWQHPYHCTLVQDGRHLLNCLSYVDLNMVRAGVVSHPKEWRWCGHDEFVGDRQRYRILNLERLADSLELGSVAEVRELYFESLERRLKQKQFERESHWTESLAVGTHEFVERTKREYGNRTQFQFDQVAEDSSGTWTVKEARAPYSVDLGAPGIYNSLAG